MSTGVVVARFQVDTLHDGHQHLLRYVAERHENVVVVLGTNETKNTMENPLDYETRRLAVQFMVWDVLPLADHPEDRVWSAQLDILLQHNGYSRTDTVLYGGPDSFLSHYSGTYKAETIPHIDHKSGTEVRAEIGEMPRDSQDFRAGVIYASQQRYPTVFTTVDIAARSETGKLLLVRKPGVEQWQLPGGFADPVSGSFEEDAVRELFEETGLTPRWQMRYAGSFNIDDWRYRNGPDKIRTLLFQCEVEGEPEPVASDDVVEARWFKINNGNCESLIRPLHLPLVQEELKEF